MNEALKFFGKDKDKRKGLGPGVETRTKPDKDGNYLINGYPVRESRYPLPDGPSLSHRMEDKIVQFDFETDNEEVFPSSKPFRARDFCLT